jgi:hypothetical protein
MKAAEAAANTASGGEPASAACRVCAGIRAEGTVTAAAGFATLTGLGLGLAAVDLDLLGLAAGVPAASTAATGLASASPAASGRRGAWEGAARRLPGSSADLMTRAYVSVIRFSRSAN